METEPSLTDPADEHRVVPVPAADYESMLRDCLRYRWLRGDVPPSSTRWPRWRIECWKGTGSAGWDPIKGSELDAAIDAAIKGG
jgi:hypothetical protein